MERGEKDAEREERLRTEIVVDAYGEEEQALGWYAYLDDRIQGSFEARCIAERAISPLWVGDEVTVVGMGPEEECRHEMFVNIRWEKRPLAVPLSQLKAIEGASASDETIEAIEDWHYWVGRGYEL